MLGTYVSGDVLETVIVFHRCIYKYGVLRRNTFFLLGLFIKLVMPLLCICLSDGEHCSADGADSAGGRKEGLCV